MVLFVTRSWVRSETRSNIYGLLSALFKEEPVRAVVEPIMDVDRLKTVREDLAMIGAGRAIDSLSRLRDELYGLDWSASDKAPFAVRREYTDLFLKRGSIHPYESMYRGEDGRLMDWPWEQVKNTYRASGVAVDSSEMHPEDHISVELGFMAVMSLMSCEASPHELGPLLEAQHAFLSEHLLAWLPDLTKDVMASPHSRVYEEAAGFAMDFVKADMAALNALQQGTERREE